MKIKRYQTDYTALSKSTNLHDTLKAIFKPVVNKNSREQ